MDTISAIDWDGLATEHWPELGPGPLSKAFKRMMGKAGVGKNMATPLSGEFPVSFSCSSRS